MGISAKAACLTNSKDVFSMAQLIAKAIDEKIAQARGPVKRFKQDANNKFVTIDMSTFSQTLCLNFTLNGEVRTMYLLFGCHQDAPELGPGKKVFASLGCWGASDDLILLAAKVLAEFGDVYTIFNDCSDEYTKQNFDSAA